ncbi:DUF4262 domain-containing protein [Alteromonas sp. 1_MG-2023]|uniref:DUF4262 domain-containing protein n=1 Tax=Alteromonas sp. 1_MG-2023 TaxID=3062669 RepID=UPI0026E1EE14|nr:DUF4262 domain-containing protein [Alteromonas sp. 1_MG-2023]MDO6565923.1 DUF4262 domain-containing protein [Alteromonas sp. 1_MG-2023]
MNDAEKKIVANIKKHGCHVTSVFDNRGESPSFTYSTGILASFCAPEVIIVGLPNKLASSVVNNYMRRVRDGEIFELGSFYPDFLSGFDVTFKEVSSLSKQEYLLSCCWYYNDKFEAVQLIFPTTSGIWPWDPEADSDFHEIQPCLSENSSW